MGTEDRNRDPRGAVWPTKQKDSHSFGELIDRFIADELGPHTTRTNPESQILLLRWWERQIGGHSPLHLVSASEIAAARTTLKSGGAISGKPVAASTINGYLTILSAAFTYGITEPYWLEDSPCPRCGALDEREIPAGSREGFQRRALPQTPFALAATPP